MIVVAYSFDVSENRYDLTFFLMLIINYIFMNNLGKNIFEIVNNMDASIKDNNKFKNIFDNLDESVIIIQDQSFQIEYVNNKFLIEF